MGKVSKKTDEMFKSSKYLKQTIIKMASRILATEILPETYMHLKYIERALKYEPHIIIIHIKSEIK